VIFVIDNSGSMGGTSIAQAKAGLVYALSRLQPNDRFNVIRFDDTMEALFADVVAADGDHLARAEAFVTALDARGGTEMIPQCAPLSPTTRPTATRSGKSYS
jgi:Ca-activated chloride channel homolog